MEHRKPLPNKQVNNFTVTLWVMREKKKKKKPEHFCPFALKRISGVCMGVCLAMHFIMLRGTELKLGMGVGGSTGLCRIPCYRGATGC